MKNVTGRRLAAALGLAVAVLPGCGISQDDVRLALRENVVVTGRVLGFALDAQNEALQTKLALIEADPRLEAKLGPASAVRKRLEQVKHDQLAFEAELKALKDRYTSEDGS